MAREKKIKRCPVSLQPDIESMLDLNSLTTADFEPASQSEKEDFIQEIDEREYIVEGSINLDDLNDRLDLDLNSDEYDSLGGFIIERLDRLPETGDTLDTEEGIHMVVEKMDKNRIELVHMYLPEALPEDGEDAAD